MFRSRMSQRPDLTLEMVSSHCRRAFSRSHLYKDTEDEKDALKALSEKYTPLLEWLKVEAGESVKDGELSLYDYKRLWLDGTSLSVVVSNRLVTSPCAIVADSMGFTANVQKLMSKLRR